jgi:hypothetical protein
MIPREPFNRNPSVIKIRLQLSIPYCYAQTPILSRLVSQYHLMVNILAAKLESGHEVCLRHRNAPGIFDVELQGTTQKISQGLDYLKALNLQILSKANVDGDSWYY